ncbi:MULTISPECIES: STAS domain-containing protein [unclassified Streptomyces]|uniref:STAS domain-containing protein n=1 Tax=unclassified Streptomyces TaxID=2593676 RepID=UPI001F0D087C|nr:STAS domain-containing protein [Streptomyces sp. A1136]
MEIRRLVLSGPAVTVEDADRLDALCRDGPRPLWVVCAAGELGDAGLADVDGLARLALAARRAGVRLSLAGAAPRLRALLDLVGLVELLGEPEHREPPGGVQEGVQPDDLPP